MKQNLKTRANFDNNLVIGNQCEMLGSLFENKQQGIIHTIIRIHVYYLRQQSLNIDADEEQIKCSGTSQSRGTSGKMKKTESTGKF